jgi:hypothetical protein
MSTILMPVTESHIKKIVPEIQDEPKQLIWSVLKHNQNTCPLQT